MKKKGVVRLSITIPGELADRLHPWRRRMNLSRTCSVALEHEVDWLETHMGHTDAPLPDSKVVRAQAFLEEFKDEKGED